MRIFLSWSFVVVAALIASAAPAAAQRALGPFGGVLGAMTDANNNALLNVNLSGTGTAAVTTTTGNTNNNLFGTRGAVTVTTGGTTEFATRNGPHQSAAGVRSRSRLGRGMTRAATPSPTSTS